MLEQSMEELRRAKMDLAPPPQPNELPQRPFGEFQEQNFEAKVCHDGFAREFSNKFGIFLGWHSQTNVYEF